MKTEQEIRDRLNEASEELQNVREWHDQAFERYRQNKKYFGEADFGEVDQSGNDLSRVSQTVSVLKWVLNTKTETTKEQQQTTQPEAPFSNANPSD